MPYKESVVLYSHIFSSVEDLVFSLKILGSVLFGDQGMTRSFLADPLGLDEKDVLHLSKLDSILTQYIYLTDTCFSTRFSCRQSMIWKVLF